jgi:hypothetical protein
MVALAISIESVFRVHRGTELKCIVEGIANQTLTSTKSNFGRKLSPINQMEFRAIVWPGNCFQTGEGCVSDG